MAMTKNNLLVSGIARSAASLTLAASSLLLFSGHLLAQGASGVSSQTLQQAAQALHAGSSGGPSIATPLTITPEGLSKLKLARGSMVNVHVFEETDLDGPYRIDDQGDINLPLAGPVELDSLSLRQAESAIRLKLIAAGILNDPHVMVNIGDYGTQYIDVTGEVVSRGRYPILAPRKLQDVLAMAGGKTALGGSEIVIHHADASAGPPTIVQTRLRQDGTSDLDTLVNPGDTIEVKKAGLVYVLGAVNRPGGFVMPEDGSLNVVDALSDALGTAPEAAISRVRILRRKADGTYVFITVPLNKIQKGELSPVSLVQDDIVYVPPSVLKEAGINATKLLSGVASAAVYEAR